jgi:hypothetical protein
MGMSELVCRLIIERKCRKNKVAEEISMHEEDNDGQSAECVDGRWP